MKLIFPLQVVVNFLVYTCPLSTRKLHGLDLCSACSCSFSLCEFICVSVLLWLEHPDSLVSSIISGSYALCLLFHKGPQDSIFDVFKLPPLSESLRIKSCEGFKLEWSKFICEVLDILLGYLLLLLLLSVLLPLLLLLLLFLVAWKILH